MEISALLPDHKILARVLMEDINLFRNDWKEKVDNPSRPILINIDGMVRDLVPSLHKYSIYDRSPKKLHRVGVSIQRYDGNIGMQI